MSKFHNYLRLNRKHPKVYCDMDGVLVDFLKGANRVTKENGLGDNWLDVINDDNELAWKIINKEGEGFWANLDWLENGRKLWANINYYSPVILSAYPYSTENVQVKIDGIMGKKEWIKKHIGEEYSRTAIICAREDKNMFADENSILIDDMEKNIKEWKRFGGIGILYKSYEKTMEELNEIL
ncbi:MAG: hypothetical protein ACOCP4_01575 [Candidatus Woesearchaeota archaeon]